MPINDFYLVVQWWLVLFVIGVFFLPLTRRFFSLFTDKGYAFSKILGVIIISYIVYILGLLKITTFTSLNIYVVFIICSTAILFFTRQEIKSLFTKKTIALFIFEEIIFFLMLFAWSYVRGNNPEIYGLEKYMDFGFVNTILRSTYFPPVDMWHPPDSINYYYFGHFITAVLTKASNIPSFITYNLMIATLFALTFVESFSLGLNLISKKSTHLRRRILSGLLIACLITLSGNLHILYTFFKPYENDRPVPFWSLELSVINPCFQKTSYEKIIENGKKQTINCSTEEQSKKYTYPNSYWYPNATRFIHNTIHEFPIYSWVVADLHGHVADIPIVLLTIATLFSLLLNRNHNHEKMSVRNAFISGTEKIIFLLIGFLLAVMYMTNAWDGLTYLLLTFLVLLYLQWDYVFKNLSPHTTNNPILQIIPIKKKRNILHSFLLKNPLVDLVIGLFVYLFIILATFFLLSLPFSLNFDSSKIVGGIGVVGAPSVLLEKNIVNIDGNKYGYDNRNQLLKLFIPDHCKSLMTNDDLNKVTTSYSTRKIGPFLFEPDHCLRSPWWQLLILYGFFYFFVTVFLLIDKRKIDFNASFPFIKILIVLSTILIIIPEFFYMKDIYPDHYRANTMFKLVFQAFIMLSIISGFTIIKTISKTYFKALSLKYKPLYLIYSLLTVVIIALVFIYPYFAITSYYNKLTKYIGLDGIQYLKNKAPDDYETIKWLNTNIKDQLVVLEAQGDSYTDYQRISANTGLPTVLGWYVHEWLWRGVDVPKPRADDVRQIYESNDLNDVKHLIKKYKISYVIIGALEREKYPMLDESKFEKLGERIFQSGNNIIIKIAK